MTLFKLFEIVNLSNKLLIKDGNLTENRM